MAKKHGKHGSHRDHPEGYGHGHDERSMKEHAGMMTNPHVHKPMGMGPEEHGRKHDSKTMGSP